MRRTLWILGIAALAAVLAIGFSQAGDDTPEKPGGTATIDANADLSGFPAPLADLRREASTIVASSTADYTKRLAALRGYPVVVNAWAAWCGPCKLEFPIFREVALKKGEEVGFLGLNVSDNLDDARAFLKKQPVPYPSLEDGDARIMQQAGGTGGLPTTFFYDKRGKRVTIHQGGYTTQKDLLADIERYLGA